MTLFLILTLTTGVASAGKIVDKDKLVKKAKDKGKVRIIVGFDAPGIQTLTQRSTTIRVIAPGTVRSHQAFEADRALSNGIKNAADKFLTRLQKANYKVNARLKHIPFIALSVNAKALEKLDIFDEVLSVVEDLPVPSPDPPEPPSSLPPESVRIPGADAQIGAESVWNKGFSGSGWYVAILDTGIRTTHEMFAGKSIVESCFSTNDAVAGALSACPDGSAASYGPGAAEPVAPDYAAYGHGTHVAGIAAGDAENVKGVAVDADIIAVQVFSRFDDSAYCGGGDCVMSFISDQVRALDWIYEMRHSYPLAAVNMSLGGGHYAAACDGDSRKAAIDNLNEAGIAVVVSSGNAYHCDGIGAPACISSAISVGAVDDGDVMADFSNWSDNGMVDLLAPGVIVFSSVASGDTDYEAWNGTSMAAPFATGAWALLKHKRPDAGVEELLNAIQATAESIVIPCDWSTVDRRIRIDSAIEQLNRPPVAMAGQDITVIEGTTVVLDGGDSSDPDPNDILSFEWSAPADILLNNLSTDQPSFTAPQVDGADRMIDIQLAVRDNHDHVATDIVRVTVTDPSPWVVAGSDQTTLEGRPVTLDGSASSDPGGSSGSLTYQWHQIGGTGVQLENADTAVTGFTAPPVGPAGDTLTFQLTVTDGAGQTGFDTCTVYVDNINQPPVANAGPDRQVTEATFVALTGSGSSDPDGTGDIASYSWVQTGGQTVQLSGLDTPTAEFIAPAVSSGDHILTFELTVTDQAGLTAVDGCSVTVKNVNQSPLSDAGLDQVTTEGATVVLSGLNSIDPDADTLSYRWTQIGGEPQVVLSDPESVNPTFVCSLPAGVASAALDFRLTVSDPEGSLSSDDVQVVIEDNRIDDFPDASVTTDTSSGTVGITTQDQIRLVKLDVVDSDSLPPADAKPKDFPYGLLDFAVKVPVNGMAIEVTVYFEQPLPNHSVWMKYNPDLGWEDYSGKVTWKKNNTMAVVQLVDGGIGDDDGMANGIIVDPSGPGIPSESSDPDTGGSGGGGGCFISSVTGR